VTSAGTLFHTLTPATGKAQPSTIARPTEDRNVDLFGRRRPWRMSMCMTQWWTVGRCDNPATVVGRLLTTFPVLQVACEFQRLTCRSKIRLSRSRDWEVSIILRVFLCYVFMLSVVVLVLVLMHYSRLVSNNKDLPTHFLTYVLILISEASEFAWRSGSVVRRTNEVTLRRARLVLGWVTVFGRVYHLGM